MPARTGPGPESAPAESARIRSPARTVAVALLAALLALVTLWAFVSYLEPVFTGEAAELLRCN